jgi:predicted Ser/Thr protein kinase
LVEDYDQNEYLTQNPYSKGLEKFPLRLLGDDILEVKILNEIGKGAHAIVYHGEYQDTPVAIKVYKNSEPDSLNAFLSEIESFYNTNE